MSRNTSIVLWIVGASIIVALFGYTFYQSYRANNEADSRTTNVLGSATTTETQSADERAVRSVVIAFGNQLQKVSVLGDAVRAAASMDAYYAKDVDAKLLAQWKANPVYAPGRVASSPWPDRIEITAVQRNADGSYTVSGEVVEVTATGNHDRKSVSLTLQHLDNSWRITRYEQFSDKG